MLENLLSLPKTVRRVCLNNVETTVIQGLPDHLNGLILNNATVALIEAIPGHITQLSINNNTIVPKEIAQLIPENVKEISLQVKAINAEFIENLPPHVRRILFVGDLNQSIKTAIKDRQDKLVGVNLLNAFSRHSQASSSAKKPRESAASDAVLDDNETKKLKSKP